MRLIRSVAAMQRLALKCKQTRAAIGFVPTMGYLHEGHVSLVKKARQIVGKKGLVVVSIYVNPTQFGPKEDFTRYPRDLERDRKLCRAAGVDVVFVPDDAQMYPKPSGAEFSTFVVEESLSRMMEGASRPAHFRGVTTVVAKLFNIVLPDAAVFGAKDFQQAAIIQRMKRDLNFPVRIVVAPTLREKDGLAMSSRNKYLTEQERAQAVVLFRALKEARRMVRSSKAGAAAESLKETLARLISIQPDARLDYIEFFDSVTLQPLSRVQPGARMALAVFFGKTRLIDNAEV